MYTEIKIIYVLCYIRRIILLFIFHNTSLLLFFSHKSKDEMKLKISAKDSSGYEAVKTVTFIFHVYPESYWEPLAIASNNSILVEESTSIAITRYDLQVESRTEMSPTDIIYMVKRPPLHGYLEIDPPSLTSNTVTVFDQATIDEGRLHYIQSISNQSSDHFTFDVTNGISSLNDLTYHFTILPKVMSCVQENA